MTPYPVWRLYSKGSPNLYTNIQCTYVWHNTGRIQQLKLQTVDVVLQFFQGKKKHIMMSLSYVHSVCLCTVLFSLPDWKSLYKLLEYPPITSEYSFCLLASCSSWTTDVKNALSGKGNSNPTTHIDHNNSAHSQCTTDVVYCSLISELLIAACS